MEKKASVAVITGAAQGIGFALAEVCLARGIYVVMVDWDALALDKSVAILEEQFPGFIRSFVCDVREQSDMQALAEKTYIEFGQVDWLFNNAGISGKVAPFWELELSEIKTVLDVNLVGVINGLQVFLPYFFKQQHPVHIINMASLYGLCSGSQLASYSMSKHAIVALTESLFFDLKNASKTNIKLSVVCPSFTNTNLLKQSQSQDAFQASLDNLLARAKPPEDIALHIVAQVEKGVFYILPDKEVKSYIEEHLQDIIHQTEPRAHALEKLMTRLRERVKR